MKQNLKKRNVNLFQLLLWTESKRAILIQHSQRIYSRIVKKAVKTPPFWLKSTVFYNSFILSARAPIGFRH